MARAILQSLHQARLTPGEVDYLNAHGTGTRLNDRIETQAIKQAFGTHASQLIISSTKSMTGHLMGAAGALEALISLLVIQEGCIPPTINYQCPDTECDLDYTPNVSKMAEVHTAMSNSLGMGGHNACLVFRKMEN
jgi:3-oxoacyl-(acyl-carrier-protein) synthase